MSYQPKVYKKQGGNEIVIASGGVLNPESGAAVLGGVTQNVRTRFTAAEVNAGATLLAAMPGYKYRIVDWTMIAIGGNAATATSVDLVATAGASTVRPAVVAVAALTRSTAVKPNTANVTLLADGASNTAFDANTAITVSKQSGGGSLATATHIDVILSYVVEAA